MLRAGGAWAATAACALALGVGAASAPAEFVASGEDPAADATDVHPGRDITAVAVAYDRDTGGLTGSVRFRGSPVDAPSFVTLLVSARTATGCDASPVGGFGSSTDELGASWLLLDAPESPPAARGEADKRGFESAVQTFEAEAEPLRGHRWDCVVATATEPGNPANVYDTAGPIDLVGQPGLAVRVRAPDELRPGRAAALRITVANPGDGRTEPVRLRLGRARGLRLQPRTKTLGSLAPGSSRTYRVAVRVGARAESTPEVELRASAGRLVAQGTLDLRVRVAHRPPPAGDDAEGSTGGQVCTRWAPDFFGDTGGSLILVPC